jgi:dihydroorotate dehydrogenase
MSRTIAVLYRFLYAALLSRLPESAAISLGQSLLRRLPLDRLGCFQLQDPRLAIKLGGVRLPNPLILAAMYYDPAILARAMGLGFGAITTKSITVQPRPGHPQPNLVRTRTGAGPGLVNCNGFQNPGLEGFRDAVASLPHRVPLIVSVAGEAIDDYVKLVRELGTLGDLVEFNISSPNTKLVYEWSEKPFELATLLRELPDSAVYNERENTPAARPAGVRIVNYGNTQKVVDRRLSQSTGGLSGPDLFPATLENLRRTRRAFGADIEIIATGGVDSPEKAWQLLHEGANAIGYFTGFITRGPILARQILERLLDGR